VGGSKKQAQAGLPDVFGIGREQMRKLSFIFNAAFYLRTGRFFVQVFESITKQYPHKGLHGPRNVPARRLCPTQ
jgi:hypothetical protein